jgi:hypothetical protein
LIDGWLLKKDKGKSLNLLLKLNWLLKKDKGYRGVRGIW